MCLTFDRHPAEVVRPESAPKVLTELDQKLELLEATGYVDTVCVLTFDKERSREPAEDFVRADLVDGLGARRNRSHEDHEAAYQPTKHGSVLLLMQL